MRRAPHDSVLAFWYEVKQHSNTMKLQRPRGYPSATMPEALELPRKVSHWSWDERGQRRVNKARWHVKRAAQRLMKRLLLENL